MSGKKNTDGVLPLPKLNKVLNNLNDTQLNSEIQRLQRFLVRRCKFIFAAYMRHLCAAVETLGNMHTLPSKFSLEDFITELAESFEETREREHKLFSKHLFAPTSIPRSKLKREKSEDDLGTGQTNLNTSSFVLDHISEAAVFMRVLFGESLHINMRNEDLLEVSSIPQNPSNRLMHSPGIQESNVISITKTPITSPGMSKREEVTPSPKRSPGEQTAAYISRGKEKLAVAEALYESRKKERADRSRSPTSPALMRSPVERDPAAVVNLSKTTPKKVVDSGSKTSLQKTSPAKVISSPSGWRDLLSSQMAKVSLDYSQSENGNNIQDQQLDTQSFSNPGTSKKDLKYIEIEYPNGRYFGLVDPQGKRTGKGRYEWTDGSIYVGEWANDLREGEGTFTWANSDSYSGAYSADKREGLGTKVYRNGETYTGYWRKGLKHGQGEYAWPNGQRYTGEWKDGVKHGIGSKTWPNGCKYEGQWKNDEMDGFGEFNWPEGDRYAGEYVKGLREGRGHKVWASGTEYIGSWKADLRDGSGELQYADKRIFRGKFSRGKKHGPGEEIFPDGTMIIGEWEEGRLISNEQANLNPTANFEEDEENAPERIDQTHEEEY
jgi:hypothetical protein